MKILSTFGKTKIFNNGYLNKLFYSSSVNKINIHIHPKEKKLFNFLKEILEHNKRKDIVLRVAGGWVRDKLLEIQKLQQQQKLKKDKNKPKIKEFKVDIDIALNKISGLKFVELIEEYKKSDDILSNKYIIKKNPEKSKHLETASINIYGFQVDFNSLRSEEYSNENSRIPDITIGTPLSDCLRRDLTINSLFFNLKTMEIEDYSGNGLDDLSNRIIRTPLNPLQTLLDDPLRAFRAIRFATRLKFKIEEQLYNSIKYKLSKQLILNKVSTDRINNEFRLMSRNKETFIQSFRYLIDTGLINSIFPNIPDLVKSDQTIKELFERSLEYLSILINYNKNNNGIFKDYLNLDFYGCFFILPIFEEGLLDKDYGTEYFKSLKKIKGLHRLQVTKVGSALITTESFKNLISVYLNNNQEEKEDFKSFLDNLKDKSILYEVLFQIKAKKSSMCSWDYPLVISIISLLRKYPNKQKEIGHVFNQFSKLLSDDNFTFEKISLFININDIKREHPTLSIDITKLNKSILILQYENPNFQKDDIINWINNNINDFDIKTK
ncbi:hypothetical protein ACTA71_011210 [Dictyostelium dimigraforme]